jgi:hypothetical protein
LPSAILAAALFSQAIPAAWADASPAPAKLALFEFELEDFSAGAQYAGDGQTDAAQLQRATAEARKLLGESGRYTLISTQDAAAAPAKARALHNCDGCEAAIASQLGADQSFAGVITRIGRTEYTVRFAIRDARTGAVVAEQRTDLRMGANYSWNRGAAALIKRWLASVPAKP